MLQAYTTATGVLFLWLRTCCMCVTSWVMAFNLGKFYLRTSVLKKCLEGLFWTIVALQDKRAGQ